MSGMDRLTDELLEAYASGKWKSYERDNIAMARELLAHRRASQPAPAPVFEDDAAEKAKLNCYCDRLDPVEAPAPSDGLREEASAVLAGLGPVHGKLMYEGYEGSANAVMNAADWIRAALITTPAPSDALREAVDAAWNDAIEAVRPVAITCFASGCDAHELDDAIRALRRAAPAEGEA